MSQHEVGLRPHLFLFAAAVVLRCASASHAVPAVSIEQISRVVPVNTALGTRVPVDFRIEVTNPLPHTVTLKAVELETVGSAGAYELKRVRHSFEQIIPAGSRSTFDVRAWVQPLQIGETGKVVSTVILRGVARFESEGGPTLRSSFTAHIRQ
jgi:hypothetical protein